MGVTINKCLSVPNEINEASVLFFSNFVLESHSFSKLDLSNLLLYQQYT